jgi:hypothetical protein
LHEEGTPVEDVSGWDAEDNENDHDDKVVDA